MRFYGFSPLKKLVEIRHEQISLAENHFNATIVQRTFEIWRRTIQNEVERKNRVATEFYSKILFRRYFRSWQRYKQQSEIAEERAERHHLANLRTKSFRIWKDFTQTEILRLWRLDDVAKEHQMKRLMKNAFVIWRQYPSERRKEREREKRLAEMRSKVKDLVPDYRGVESSSQN